MSQFLAFWRINSPNPPNPGMVVKHCLYVLMHILTWLTKILYFNVSSFILFCHFYLFSSVSVSSFILANHFFHFHTFSFILNYCLFSFSYIFVPAHYPVDIFCFIYIYSNHACTCTAIYPLYCLVMAVPTNQRWENFGTLTLHPAIIPFRSTLHH